MRSPHIKTAHSYWKAHLRQGDFAIDATLGGGYDALFIASLILKGGGELWGFDIQKEAIQRSEKRLQENLSSQEMKQVTLFHASHQKFPLHPTKKPSLIVYNLGYLPGGDKTIVTQTKNTLQSVTHALSLIKKGGVLSITCYRGHQEGEKEERALIKWLHALPYKNYTLSYQKWLHGIKTPSLILIKKHFQ